ncbi:MAG: helix-turn-helix transcriptional regulator [Deltaproteobacteria bacterium]|nr:helix-turn-helix transcriptional regulator [Deltaproteobacteria bacterium]
MTRNITLAIDPEVLDRVRVIAVERKTTVNALVREYLEGLATESDRMAEARRRLLHSDEMIDVIAERVGYADPTAFIRMFRREHGKTPAAWRREHARSG